MSPLIILSLYLAFRAKQFVCDFILQTTWMAMKKGLPGLEGYKPLLAHSAVHGAGTLCVFLVFAPTLWWFALVDILVHATVDRIKAVVTRKAGWHAKDTLFWWSYGVDQEVHNLTHLAYLIMIVAHYGGIA